MVQQVTDPALLNKLNGADVQPVQVVTDPALLARLNDDKPKLAEKTGVGETIRDQFLQTATFGFGDELQAAIAAPFVAGITDKPLGEAYDAALDVARRRLEQQREQNPGTAIASGLAGAVGTGVAGAGTKLGKAVASRVGAGGLIGRTAKSAAVGATTGAAFGAGAAEGDTSRLEGAVEAAPLGAIFGATVPAVSAGLGKTLRGIKQAFKGREADKILAQRLAKQDLSKLKADLQNASGDTVLADIAGDEVKGLMRTVGRMSGGSKDVVSDFLNKRSNAAVSRVTKTLSQKISNTDAYFGNLDDMAKARSLAAAPLYKQAYKEATKIKDPRLAKFLEDKRVIDAINTAKKQYGVRVEAASNSLETLDGAKKVLDDVIGAAERNNQKQLSAQYTILKNQLLDVLDDASPSYSKARKVFADFKSLENAQESGSKFTRLAPEQIKRTVKGMNPSELEAFKIGVRANLQKTVSGTADGADPAKRIFGNTLKREQLQAVFGKDRQFKAFEKRMRDEIAAADTKFKVIGGSRTDINLEEDGGQMIMFAKNAIQEGSVGAARDATNALAVGIRNRFVGITKKNAVELAKTLTSRKEGLKAIDRIIVQNAGDAVQQRIIKQAQKELPLIVTGAAGGAQ